MEGIPSPFLPRDGSRYHVLPAVLAVMALAAPTVPALGDGKTYSTYQPVVPLHDSGPPQNRFDFVIATDGYTRDSDPVAHAYALDTANYFISPRAEKPTSVRCAYGSPECRVDTEPYVRYRNFLNFHRIRAFSNEDFTPADIQYGVRESGPIITNPRDTIFDIANLLAVEATSQDSTIDTGIDRDGGLWLAAALMGGAHYGWGAANAATENRWVNFRPGEVAVHEAAHAAHILVDEFYNPGTRYSVMLERPEWNVTVSPSCEKWARWIGYYDARISPQTGKPMGTIGCYEGAATFEKGLYRPVQQVGASRMSGAAPFNRISMEKIIYDLYGQVRPLDAYRGNSRTLTNPSLLWVNEVDPAVVKIDWTIADALGNEVMRLVDHGGVLDMKAIGLAGGEYRVTAHAYDEAIRWSGTGAGPDAATPGDLDTLDLARAPEVIERMQQSVAWSVLIDSSLPANDDIDVRVPEGQRFAVDRGHPSGAIVGWVQAYAPRGHRFALLEDRGWLNIDPGTGLLTVGDSSALAEESIDSVGVRVQVLSSVGGRTLPSETVIHVDINDSRQTMVDEFADGHVEANTHGNGRGFVVPVSDNADVIERDGVVRLSLDGRVGQYQGVNLLSKDSFDFVSESGIDVSWKIESLESQQADCYLLLVSSRSALEVATPAIITGRATEVRGLAVRLSGGYGALLAVDPWLLGERTLATWDWTATGWDRKSDLLLTLSASTGGVRVAANGIELATANWPAEFADGTADFSGLIRSEPLQRRTVRVGAHLAGPSAASVSLGSVRVKVSGEPVPENRPPQVLPGGVPDTSAPKGQSLSLDLNNYVTDPDGDPLQFRVTNLPPGVAAQEDGSIAGTPTQPGRYQVSFSASDGLAKAVGTFGIEVAPAVSRARTRDTGRGGSGPRLIRSLENLVVTVGEPVSLDLAEHFDDPDGDALSFGVAGLPDGLSVGSDGLLQGAPVETGRALVYVSVSDGRTRMPATTFAIDVVESTETKSGDAPPVGQTGANRAPRLIRPLPDVIAPFGKPVKIDLDGYFADPDGDPLAYGLTGNPPGLRLNDGSVLRGIMPPGGEWTIGVTVTDPHGDTAMSVLSVRVESRSGSLRDGDRPAGRSSRPARHH